MSNALSSNIGKLSIVFLCCIIGASAEASPEQALKSNEDAIVHVVNQPVVHSIGIARNTDDQTIRYVEHHQYLSDGTHLVRYFDDEQQLMLEKDLAYPGLPQHPVFVQRDVRTDTVTTVTRNENGRFATISPADKTPFSFELSDDIVIDAGFDRFIQSNWGHFQSNADKSVRFAVPGQNRLLKMKISKQGSSEGLTHFTIKPENWLVRLLLPEISLSYDDHQRLKRYQGFSNLKPAQNETREVVISFRHYSTNRAIEHFPAEWIATAAE